MHTPWFLDKTQARGFALDFADAAVFAFALAFALAARSLVRRGGLPGAAFGRTGLANAWHL